MKSDIRTETDEWRKPKGHHKDTAHWCRGHVGVEHEPTMVKTPGPLQLSCGMRPSYRDESEKVWHCTHQVKCVGCGKVLEALPAEDCPDRH